MTEPYNPYPDQHNLDYTRTTEALANIPSNIDYVEHNQFNE